MKSTIKSMLVAYAMGNLTEAEERLKTVLAQKMQVLESGATKGYDTSEKNREYYDDHAEWVKAVRQAGADVAKKSATVDMATGHDGECGAFDKTTNKGWVCASFIK